MLTLELKQVNPCAAKMSEHGGFPETFSTAAFCSNSFRPNIKLLLDKWAFIITVTTVLYLRVQPLDAGFKESDLLF